MIVQLFRFFIDIFPNIKGFIWKRWYQFLAKFYQKKDWGFMNYGYAPIGDSSENVCLNNKDIDNRFCVQLYHHVASAVELKDLNVLEVGSGRGGGADYVNRYFKPNKMVGVDFSENAVNFCNQNYPLNGLSFEAGNAESLPFPENSFDIVINVESSHCYNSFENFLGQVKQVLRKGGYFLFTDLRSKADLVTLKETLQKSGLNLISDMDITPNVLEALKLDHENKIALVNQNIHKLMTRTFLQFAGTKGSKIYESFENRETLYHSFVLQK